MTETTVGADLLEALEILTELGVDTVGKNLVVLAIDNVALPVEEPRGDLVLGRVLDDGDDTLELFGGELTGAAGLVSLRSCFVCVRVRWARTACSGRHRPSCRPSWSNGDRHP